jgi:hypothetical protein
MNHNLFPDKLINQDDCVGLVSKKTDWRITQNDRTGIVEIKLRDRNCYEAYHQAKAFGINVDRKWWQFWLARPEVYYKDTRVLQGFLD